ncbi:hypothetical protein [Kribbella sp. NBC_00889]|uniref:hypothetical protein n=1 Tax=Kribbella sp. NBC_00889 TaxID=2975974 RepID=UPI00386A6089|nr:hypothetical protein OG817_34825 [Kribbella sp. NBC_00889]
MSSTACPFGELLEQLGQLRFSFASTAAARVRTSPLLVSTAAARVRTSSVSEESAGRARDLQALLAPGCA